MFCSVWEILTKLSNVKLFCWSAFNNPVSSFPFKTLSYVQLVKIILGQNHTYESDNEKNNSWLISRGGGGGGGRYSPKFRKGVCRERSQTLTLSKDKENEN